MVVARQAALEVTDQYRELLDREPHPTRDQIKDALSGVLCRCTGYLQIFESVEDAMVRASRPPAREARDE